MMKKTRTKKNNRGFVLPLVVALIAILAFTGIGLLKLGQHARLRSITNTADIRARAAADAGLIQAIHLLNKKIDDNTVWNNDVLPTMTDIALPNSSETFSFKITGTPSSFNIVSTGRSVNAQRKVYSTTRLKSVFNFAVAVNDDLVLFPNCSIDGYNSTTGETGIPVQIGTNSISDDSVIIMNGSSVDGDVYVGVAGDPAIIIQSRGTITGETYAMPQEVYFPPVSPPSDLVSRGFIKDSATIYPADSGTYSYLALGNSELLTIAGGDVVLYVTGDIDMANGSEITIQTGSSLTIYIDGDFKTKEGTTISSGVTNENSIPSDFKLFGTGEIGQVIDLKAKNEFYGAVYAPNASISIKAKGDIYGSFVGNDFELKSYGKVHYDKALAKTTVDDADAYFTINNWREE